ncbi:hypothetical protein SAMN05216413_0777 [Ruminococcaceae bacterium KH2T8]|nr:hypothetical protein SAMN05216413_0777 [Ruminococcaceae bacterium KH2T8]
MASFGSTKGYGKKDINFFAQFTESARKQARMLLYVILIGLIFFGVFFAWLIFDIIRNGVIKAEIKKLNDELASPEYANLEIEYKNLQQTLNERNQYFYALTEMRREVDEISVADTDLATYLGDSIPNDSYIDSYSISGNEMQIIGYTFDYYSALELVNMMQNNDVFVNLNAEIVHVDTPAEGAVTVTDGSIDTMNTIDVYYKFTITGNLTLDTYISVSRFVLDDTGAIAPLSGVETVKYEYGDAFSVDGINSYESNGVTYYLSYILINGVRVDDDQYAAISANNAVSGIAVENTEIELYYTAAAPVAEEGAEGGEAA